MSDPQSAPRGTKLLPMLAIAAFGAFVTGLALFPEWSATALMTDDAYYYLEIARNIVQVGESTFDGFEQTNGYHPLWMLIVCGIVAVAGSDPMTAVTALLMTSAAIAFATTALAYRLVRDRLAAGFGWHAVALCVLPNVWIGMTNGMETGLLSLLLLLFVRQAVVRDALDPQQPAGATVGLGALLGCILLARLDSAFLLIAVGVVTVLICLAERLPVAVLLRRGLLLGGTAGAVAAPYFWWNVSTFGSPMPISGAVKSTLPALRPDLSLHTDMAMGLGLVIVLLAATAVLLRSERLEGVRFARQLRSPFPALALGASLHFVHAWLFLDWGVYWWHFTMAAITLTVAVPAATARMTGGRTQLRPLLHVGAAGVALAGLAMQALVTRNKDARHESWLEAANWARSNTADDAVFALKDAGLFGYFAQRQVVNLDGKAGGLDYIAAMKDAVVDRYLRTRGVDYIADIEATYHDGVDTIYLPRAGTPGVLVQVPARLEVYRAAAAPGRYLGAATEADGARFTIWRFDPAAISVQ